MPQLEDLIGQPPVLGESGVAGIVLDLHVHDQSAAGVQRRVEAGDRAPELGGIGRRDGSTVGEMRVVVDHQVAVEGTTHVELDAVRALVHSAGEGADGVLGEIRRGTPMPVD
jgi:hypothetical protein